MVVVLLRVVFEISLAIIDVEWPILLSGAQVTIPPIYTLQIYFFISPKVVYTNKS